eukprot:GSMAST32.ASY1.ANO1.2835.1 assembled CDS
MVLPSTTDNNGRRRDMPELKKLMEKRLRITMNKERIVVGYLRGFDMFMNLVVDESVEVRSQHDKKPIGMVLIRGNSVVEIEVLESVNIGQTTLGQAVFM